MSHTLFALLGGLSLLVIPLALVFSSLTYPPFEGEVINWFGGTPRPSVWAIIRVGCEPFEFQVYDLTLASRIRVGSRVRIEWDPSRRAYCVTGVVREPLYPA